MRGASKLTAASEVEYARKIRSDARVDFKKLFMKLPPFWKGFSTSVFQGVPCHIKIYSIRFLVRIVVSKYVKVTKNESARQEQEKRSLKKE